ncbi:hypothetical protein FGIG_12587 [Fasciola gigantica]|uniref:Integrase zinc-binding domain-containing protein n=1 Tax=Fasciola gigantica TaxID=46835 RepID=A0A504YYV2_FASGI|nr:hypothetical protein FGIG_12587 [Fasciola gigantica]
MLLHNPEHDEWTKSKSTDPDLRFLCDRLSNQQLRSSEDVQGTSYNVRCLWALWTHLRLVDGILAYQNGLNYLHRTVVPATTIETILRRLHEELGHAGQNELEDDIFSGSLTYRPSETRLDCGRRKSPAPSNQAPLQMMSLELPDKLVAVYIGRPLSQMQSRIRCVLVVADHFNSSCKATPL